MRPPESSRSAVICLLARLAISDRHDTRCQGVRACCPNPFGVRRQRESDALSGLPATPLWLPAERRDGRNQTSSELCQWLRSAVSQSGVAGRPDKTSASLCRRTPQKSGDRWDSVLGDTPFSFQFSLEEISLLLPVIRAAGRVAGRPDPDHSRHFVDILLKRAGLIPGITRKAFL